MSIRRQGLSFVVALGVAYLLVLQILLAGVALGSHAGPLLSEGSGAILCSTAAQAPSPEGPRSLPHLPDCCSLGCLAGTTAPPASSVVATLIPIAREVRAGFPPIATAARAESRWHIPRNSRAPPRPA